MLIGLFGGNLMKILQINSVCGVGSTGRIATDIHKTLIEQGHESYIAYGRDLPRNCDNVIRIGSKLDTLRHVALTRVFDKHGFGSKKATKELINIIKNINPDIIHLHNIHGYYINIELLFNYIESSKKKVIWTLHDCWAITGHCSYFEHSQCHKWMEGCMNCQLKREYPASYILDNSKNSYLRKRSLFNITQKIEIVSISNWLNSIVEKSFLKDNHLNIIYNGIDTNVFKYSKSDLLKRIGIKDKYVILGVASQWTNRKGLDRFIELSKYIKDDEIILLVGLEDQQILKLPTNIKGIKKLGSIQDLVEIYSEADVFVNMSYEETFGLVTAEAMACGTPVVVFNTTANPELVNENVGKVINKDDIEGVYDAVSFFKKADKDILRINCKRHVENNYSKLQMHSKYMSLYERVYNFQSEEV
jgi:glycosyltransferase involved in cell wall biosynthesis